jgi:UDP-N-acetylmuramate dehydrogenase
VTDAGAITAAGFDAFALGGEIQRRLGVKTSREEPLGRFTTMRVGGPADLFAVAHNAFELRGLAKFARARGVPLTVLGRGSNVVISDRGIRGLVVQNRAEGLRVHAGTEGSAEPPRAVAESGVPMARLATETQTAGLTGLEFGLAIPGSVGGAVWANAGAHDADIASVLESASVLLADGREALMAAAELDLSYRHSRFKDAAAAGDLVISATFRLAHASADEIKRRLDEIRRWRQAHQPLGVPSAGSFFRNPGPADAGAAGRSAGALIDQAGLKGARIGGASVSPKHANFLVNDGRGTAADVRRLGDLVRATVEDRFGVTLRHEVVFLGDWSGWPIANEAGANEAGANEAGANEAGANEAGAE